MNGDRELASGRNYDGREGYGLVGVETVRDGRGATKGLPSHGQFERRERRSGDFSRDDKCSRALHFKIPSRPIFGMKPVTDVVMGPAGFILNRGV